MPSHNPSDADRNAAVSYAAIYLAPHLDDVALSCGGQVYDRTAAGQRILIVTVMAGSPHLGAQSAYIESLHARWELAGDAAAERRAEDIAACAILGADYLHLDVADCIYRLHPEVGTPLYNSDDDIFGDVHTAEDALQAELAARFQTLPHVPHVIAPLTVGHHVDHLLVRAAAERVWPQGLAYYEDYPYVENRGYLNRVLGDDLRRWRPDVFDVSERGLQAKFDAIWAFRSQLSTFFGSRAEMEARVGRYCTEIGGERLWLRL
jgi:LmbE family N-acetylglucosaminyl deacetylase